MLKARMLVESLLDEPKETLSRDKIIKEQVCPHCGDVIHEKGTFYENDTFRHRTCGGALLSAQPDPAMLAALKKHWGMDYDPATRKFTPQEQNRS
jgi:hypothetical protein